MTASSAPASNRAAASPAGAGPRSAQVPLCYVVDEEPSVRHFLSLVLHGWGIDTVEFPDGASLRPAMAQRVPDLIFLNISTESADAIESVVSLGKGGFAGAVQLMSNRGTAVLEHVRAVGLQHKLNMLPVLKKPFETDAIVKIINRLNLGTQPVLASRLDLDEALANKWIEFWYQPKIDLRKRQLVGAEAYARARHPVSGVVLPAAFMAGASTASLVALSELALANVLKAGLAFSRLGINMPLTVNIPVDALVKLPVEDIVRTHRTQTDKWAGLVIDVPAAQIVADLALTCNLARKLGRDNVCLAIDDFGQAHSSVAKLSELPFCEIKINRALVADCGSNKAHAPLCKSVIDLAHRFGRKAVAMGIEKAADVTALVSMGCDYGQGFLLGQPMPEARFLSLLRQRVGTRGRNPAPGAAPIPETRRA